jgi:hypothetical protein
MMCMSTDKKLPLGKPREFSILILVQECEI